jgi:hypothetical protein
MAMKENSKNQRDFFRIVRISTALAFGVMAAFLYSIKDIGHDSRLEFSAGTVVAFLIAALVGWGFWQIILKLNKSKTLE